MSLIDPGPHPWKSPPILDHREILERTRECGQVLHLPQQTLDYIVRQNLIGAADVVARKLGVLSDDPKKRALETYTYTSYFGREEKNVELPDADIHGKFWVERFKWDGGFMIIVKDADIRRFVAIPVEEHKKCVNPVVLYEGKKYVIMEYEPGSWIPRLLNEYRNSQNS